jgi:hypothetical protein
LQSSNASFLRQSLLTCLEHNGCQLEMQLGNDMKARKEWDDLLKILSLELTRITGSPPRIVEESNNQWGIYCADSNGGKSTRPFGSSSSSM